MSLNRANSWRKFCALLCLLAALCLYAPLTISAWPARTSCCDGNHCAVPTHLQRSASNESGHGMECQHGTAGTANCTMACCQQDRAPVVPVVYVMPAPV